MPMLFATVHVHDLCARVYTLGYARIYSNVCAQAEVQEAVKHQTAKLELQRQHLVQQVCHN